MSKNTVNVLSLVVTGVSLVASVAGAILGNMQMQNTVTEEVAKAMAEQASKESV